MTLLVDYARELGVAMGSLQQGRHVGWTTDAEKMGALRERDRQTYDYPVPAEDRG